MRKIVVLKDERIRREWEKTHALLVKSGFFELVKKHGRTRPNFTPPRTTLPDLPTLGTGFANPTPKRPPLPKDAKQFTVGNSHKQGLELITPGSNPADYNGAKK